MKKAVLFLFLLLLSSASGFAAVTFNDDCIVAPSVLATNSSSEIAAFSDIDGSVLTSTELKDVKGGAVLGAVGGWLAGEAAGFALGVAFHWDFDTANKWAFGLGILGLGAGLIFGW